MECGWSAAALLLQDLDHCFCSLTEKLEGESLTISPCPEAQKRFGLAAGSKNQKPHGSFVVAESKCGPASK